MTDNTGNAGSPPTDAEIKEELSQASQSFTEDEAAEQVELVNIVNQLLQLPQTSPPTAEQLLSGEDVQEELGSFHSMLPIVAGFLPLVAGFLEDGLLENYLRAIHLGNLMRQHCFPAGDLPLGYVKVRAGFVSKIKAAVGKLLTEMITEAEADGTLKAKLLAMAENDPDYQKDPAAFLAEFAQ